MNIGDSFAIFIVITTIWNLSVVAFYYTALLHRSTWFIDRDMYRLVDFTEKGSNALIIEAF